MNAGLLIDTTRCVGCNACSEACKEANDLPEEIDPKLTARTWTVELGDKIGVIATAATTTAAFDSTMCCAVSS